MSNENVFDNFKHRDLRRLPNCPSPTRDEITVLPNRKYINGWKLCYYFEIITTPCGMENAFVNPNSTVWHFILIKSLAGSRICVHKYKLYSEFSKSLCYFPKLVYTVIIYVLYKYIFVYVKPHKSFHEAVTLWFLSLRLVNCTVNGNCLHVSC